MKVFPWFALLFNLRGIPEQPFKFLKLLQMRDESFRDTGLHFIFEKLLM